MVMRRLNRSGQRMGRVEAMVQMDHKTFVAIPCNKDTFCLNECLLVNSGSQKL